MNQNKLTTNYTLCMHDIQVQGQNLEDSSKPGLFLLDYSF